MRKIKFRLYNPTTKEMENIKSINFDTKTNEAFLTKNNRINRAGKLSAFFPIMQFTGLKDSKGTEIYEGDIVEFKGVLFVVSYNENEAHYALQTMRCGKLKNDSILTSFIASIGEVVGNIHQNSELLKWK